MKYQIDTDFFKKWSQEMAWCLGVLVGDGNVSGNRLSLEMADRDVVEKVKGALKAEHPIYVSKRRNKKTTYVFGVSDKHLVKTAAELRLIPRKSKIMQFPPVPEEFLSHFLRGFLDSNGSIFMQGRPNSRKIVVALYTASEMFGKQLEAKIREAGFTPHLYSRSHRSFEGRGYPGKSWRVHCWDRNFLPWIYQNKGNFYMERKYQKFQELLSKLGSKGLV